MLQQKAEEEKIIGDRQIRVAKAKSKMKDGGASGFTPLPNTTKDGGASGFTPLPNTTKDFLKKFD